MYTLIKLFYKKNKFKKYINPILDYLFENCQISKTPIYGIDFNIINIENPNINETFVNKYSFIQKTFYKRTNKYTLFELYMMVRRYDISLDNIEEILNDYNLYYNANIWNHISYNENINMNFLKKYIDRNFDWDIIIKNISLYDLLTLIKYNNNILYKCNILDKLKIISYYESIYIEDTINELEKYIIMSKEELYRFILNNKNNKKLNWNLLSQNEKIELSFIENNLDLDWNWSFIKYRYDITPVFIFDNKDKWIDLDWSYFVKAPYITLDIINNNPDMKWNYYYIYDNPNIKLNDIINDFSNYKNIKDRIDKGFYNYSKTSSTLNNLYCYHEYYQSSFYKKILVKKFMDLCWEEFIKKIK